LQKIKDELQARLDNIELQKDAFEAAEDAAIAAKIAAGEYNDVLTHTLSLLGQMAAMWAAIAEAARLASIQQPVDPSFAIGSSSYIPPAETAASIAEAAAFDAVVQPLVAAEEAAWSLEDAVIAAQIALEEGRKTGNARIIQALEEDLAKKPADIKEKIVEGRIQKRLKELTLMDQSFIRDSSITIDELIKQNVAKLGENIQVRRFERFVLGEGLQKKTENFSEEVEKMIKK
jgi:hypothetical protein